MVRLAVCLLFGAGCAGPTTTVHLDLLVTGAYLDAYSGGKPLELAVGARFSDEPPEVPQLVARFCGETGDQEYDLRVPFYGCRLEGWSLAVGHGTPDSCEAESGLRGTGWENLLPVFEEEPPRRCEGTLDLFLEATLDVNYD